MIALVALIDTSIDDCAKDGNEQFLTKIPCGIEDISQSNQSKFIVTQSTW